MTDELRLGTLGDAVLQTGATIPIPHQGGISIPTPRADDGMTVPVRAFGGDDLPIPPIPLYGDDLPILYSGISIPTP